MLLPIFPELAPREDLWTISLESIKGHSKWNLSPVRKRRATQATKYREYLQSDGWMAKRRSAIARAGHKCGQCGSRTPELEVHHLTYANLGNESDEDLIALCGLCHVEADKKRAARTQGRNWAARLDGWASKKYGQEWEETIDVTLAEDEFCAWLESQEDDEL